MPNVWSSRCIFVILYPLHCVSYHYKSQFITETKKKKSKRHDIRHWKRSVIHLWIQVRTRGTPFPSLLIPRSLSLDHCHFITNPGCATDLCIQSSVSTSRKRSCGKVMFLHLSVILFTGGRGSLYVLYDVTSCLTETPLLDRDPPGQRLPFTVPHKRTLVYKSYS